MKEKIYVISGLGADERVFQRLDLSDFEVIFIRWISPQPSESMEHYALRLLDQIKTDKPILVGLSFGGMMAIEIAKQIETKKIILISSAGTSSEIPFYFRIAGQLRLHKLLPMALLKHSNGFSNWIFGTTTDTDKLILKNILRDTEPEFLKWAIDKVVRWSNKMQIENVFHIHGTNDKLLPFRFVKYHEAIENGGHLLVLDRAEELSKILKQQIAKKTT